MSTDDSTSTARWERLAEVYEHARRLPAAERRAFVTAATEDMPDLAADVLEMLAGDTVAGELELEQWLVSPDNARPDDLSGTLIGSYRIVEPIGRGGMGEVYLATRVGGPYDQRVALKILKAGLVGPHAISRFERERRILARLEHPSVVPLLDGGIAPDGRPYLVLQYVDGLPITEAADRRRLDVRGRLRQFIQVCRAVHDAHSRLIVHRDLKPSNILVTGEGDVRLLDFGIARVLEPDAADVDEGATREPLAPMTPERAAPEQFRGESPSPATDVWALGVLLHELLTGHLPHDVGRSTPTTAARELASRAAPRLSRAALEASAGGDPEAAAAARGTTPRLLSRLLRGDLETIVGTALQPDPQRRYDSARGLADDVAAYLDGRPLTARPEGTWERTRRFARRHRLAVASAVVALLGLVAGTGVALWQAREARSAQREAESVASFVSALLRDASIDAPGSASDVLVADLLERAPRRIDALQAAPHVRVRLLNLVGDALRGLGRAEAFDRVAAQAQREARASLAPSHPDALRASLLRASAHMQRGRPAEASSVIDGVMPWLQADPSRHALDLARAWRLRADVAMTRVTYPEAKAAARRAIEVGERYLPQPQAETAAAYRTLGEVHVQAEEAADAVKVSARALELTLAAHAGQPAHPWVLAAHELHAKALADAGDLVPAVAALERALATKIAMQGPRSRNVGLSTHNLAGNQMRIGRLSEAIANSTRALDILDDHIAPDAIDFVNVRNLRGLLMAQVRRGDEAAAAIEAGLAASTGFFGPRDAQTFVLRAVAALGHAYAGRLDKARGDVATIVREMRAAGTPVPRVLTLAARANRLVGAEALAAGQFEEAGRLYGATPPPAAARDAGQARLERLLIALDRREYPDDVLTARLGAVLTDLDALYAVATPAQADGHVALGRLALRNGHADEALRHAEAAMAVWQGLGPGTRWMAEAVALRDAARASTR